MKMCSIPSRGSTQRAVRTTPLGIGCFVSCGRLGRLRAGPRRMSSPAAAGPPADRARGSASAPLPTPRGGRRAAADSPSVSRRAARRGGLRASTSGRSPRARIVEGPRAQRQDVAGHLAEAGPNTRASRARSIGSSSLLSSTLTLIGEPALAPQIVEGVLVGGLRQLLAEPEAVGERARRTPARPAGRRGWSAGSARAPSRTAWGRSRPARRRGGSSME